MSLSWCISAALLVDLLGVVGSLDGLVSESSEEALSVLFDMVWQGL